MINKTTLGAIVALVAVALGYLGDHDLDLPGLSQTDAGQAGAGMQDVAAAYRARRSDVQVRGSGVVRKILRDDNDGSRHQRFLLELNDRKNVLVAHNIDLAPRIEGLRNGDEVAFYGEYEWNSKGGVVHWTHHDPGRRHVGGWLKHRGHTYQ